MGLTTTQLKPARVAIYARVSPKPEGAAGDNFSIASQLHEMKALALKDFGCAKPDEYIDNKVSGATLDRPELDRLRDHIALKFYDVVIAYSPDRWTRGGLSHTLLLDEELKKGGATMAFVSGSYEDSPEGRFARNVQAAASEFEKEKIKERSRRCRREKSREGFPHACKAPDGFKYEGHKFGKKGEWVLDGDRPQVILTIAQMTARGMTNYGVAAELNRQGILTQKGCIWSAASVAQVMRKKCYWGEMMQN